MNASKTFLIVKCLNDLTLSFSVTTYVLFILSTGHTLLVANLANVVFMVTIFLLDPLTGHWGDRYGHRQVYLLGICFWAAGTFAYFASNLFWHFTLAEFLCAIGKSLESEALEAWLLNSEGHAVAHKMRAKASSVGKLAGIATALLGSHIGAVYGYRYPWLASTILALISLVVAYYLLSRQPNYPTTQGVRRSSLRLGRLSIVVVGGFKRSWRLPRLRWTLLIVFATTMVFQPVNMFWTEIVIRQSGLVQLPGIMWVAIAIAIAFGSLISGRFYQVRLKHFAYLCLFISLPLFLAALSLVWSVTVIGFLLHEIPRGSLQNFLASYANHDIRKRQRAMLNSVRSSVGMLGAALGLILSGILSEVINPEAVWLLSASVLVAFAVVLITKRT